MKKKSSNQKYTAEQAIQLIRSCYRSGEPVFILRAQDRLAWEIVKAYAEKLKNKSGPDHPEKESYKLAENAEKVAAEMLEWQLENQDKSKLPD